MNNPDDEWIKTLEDGRKVKFVYQALPEGGAFITAQMERHEVVYSGPADPRKAPLDRQEVESHFATVFSGEIKPNCWNVWFEFRL